VHLRARHSDDAPSSPRPTADDLARAKFLLLFELEHSEAAFEALTELWRLLRGEPIAGFGLSDRAPATAWLNELTQLLEAEAIAGRVELWLEPFAGRLKEREQLDIQLPSLPKAPQPAPETSFIAIRLVDQNGAPVIGHAFDIELPDGTKHRGFTDPDGFGRVRGFVKDGLAKITFQRFDELDFKTGNASARIIIPVNDAGSTQDENEGELDEEPAEDGLEVANELSALDEVDGHFIELLLIDTDDIPVANESVVVTDSAGTEFEAISDDFGKIRVDGLAPGEAKVELRQRDGHDWSVEELA